MNNSKQNEGIDYLKFGKVALILVFVTLVLGTVTAFLLFFLGIDVSKLEIPKYKLLIYNGLYILKGAVFCWIFLRYYKKEK